MTRTIINLACPGCGARVSTGQEKCEYCGGPIMITTLESVQSLSTAEANKYTVAYRKALAENPGNRELNASLAACYLRLKLYDKAIAALEDAMEDNLDNPEIFFLAAACLLRGQKAFVARRPDVDKILDYLNAAIMIEPRGIYHYFLAYVKHDYFRRKYLNISPDHVEEYHAALELGVSEDEIQRLFSTLGVERPGEL
ncbi:MAG: tetratricopeptide repeat protein [Odoribacteraceae bacterium]|jgi:tetratricopeptide (TPR) repeat protein|nr:tetratricopeptide repeat protein [Odoribacteraceae bacterium]